MIRGVIFDLGGTLAEQPERLPQVDLDARNAAALRSWLEQQGITTGDRFIDDLVAARQACFARRMGGLQEVTAAEALRPILERYGAPAHDRFLQDAEATFFEPELAAMQLLPGAIEVLRRLQGLGLRLGLASNASSHYFVVECCRRLGLATYLDPILSSAAVGWAKPSAQLFTQILDTWAVPADAAVIVGDTPGADVAGAQAVGMPAILLVRPQGGAVDAPTYAPDAQVASLFEAAEVIERWLYQLR